MRKPNAVILSQGCAANFGDGEKIARVLSSKYEVSFKFPESETAEEPTAFFLNVCTVKGNAGAMKLLRKVASAYPKAPSISRVVLQRISAKKPQGRFPKYSTPHCKNFPRKKQSPPKRKQHAKMYLGKVRSQE